MSLNIVWGYPWTGMLGACIAILSVGWLVNWLTRPSFHVGCTLPVSSPAGSSFGVTVHLSNANKIPALDTSVGFDDQYDPALASGTHWSGFSWSKSPSKWVQTSDWQFFPLIRPGDRTDHAALLSYPSRGVYPLPNLLVQSTFPFYLFRTTTQLDLGTTIAITPAPVDTQQDVAARKVLANVGSWAHRFLGGDAMEYAGSREYEVGMPVRQWDFVSWARLGRPIVREYQSPSVRSMNLVIDTSHCALAGSTTLRGDDIDPRDAFEHLLSTTVNVIAELVNKSVLVNLYLTSEPSDVVTSEDTQQQRSNEPEAMLIRLASAEQVDVGDAERRMRIVVEHLGRQPTLLVTLRERDEVGDFGRDVTVISVRGEASELEAHRDVQSTTSPPVARQAEVVWGAVG
ncbi:MAG: DUF58 domain-containing protein [Pirellulaceae bacterium]|nr:DUF58 domain-containing protein [Pirellulaceae bacterium]